MAISFNELGSLGHLGNQMFQYASLQGIAKNRNTNWYIPSRQNFGRGYHPRSNIYDCFYLDSFIEDHEKDTEYPTIFEKNHGFDKDLFRSCPNDVNLSGYLQDYRYFEDIQNKIRRDFTFRSDIVMQTLYKCNNTLAIHVRRTDYTTFSSHHTNLGEEYYATALNIVGHFDNAIVFSDDISWCQEQAIFKDFEFAHFGSPYVDLYIMSQCSHHIIANSSFSWWGAWLAESNDVVAPENWFGPALPNHDPAGFFLPSWKVI